MCQKHGILENEHRIASSNKLQKAQFRSKMCLKKCCHKYCKSYFVFQSIKVVKIHFIKCVTFKEHIAKTFAPKFEQQNTSSLPWFFLCFSFRFCSNGVYSNYTINYDVCRIRRYRRNILQWDKNNIECMKRLTGDYYTCINKPGPSCKQAFFEKLS